MGTVMTDILTNADLRSDRAVQDAMMNKAEVTGPWFSAPEQ